jgi:hypothetical protein
VIIKVNLKILFFILPLLFLFFTEGNAQVEDNSAEGLYFTKENSFGLVAHTSGWGLEYRSITNKGAFKKRIKSLELVSLRHPKEIRVKNAGFRNSKGFVYGKLYNLWAIRPGFGFQKVLYGKEIKSALQISRIFSIGPSLFFCKPVYLEISVISNDPNFNEFATVRYDPEEHSINEIYGKAPFLAGLEKSVILPGIFLKWAYQFDFTQESDRIKYLEIGSCIDIQPLGIQQMAFNKRQFAFVNLYLSFAFGKKMYQ